MKSVVLGSVLGMVTLALTASVWAADLKPADLVRREAAKMEQRIREAHVNGFKSLEVDEGENGEVLVSISIGSRSPYVIRVLLKDVTEENLVQKVDEAVALIILDAQDYMKRADVRLSQLSGGLTNSGSFVNELRTNGVGLDTVGLPHGGVSFWGALPPVAHHEGSMHRWGRVTFRLQGMNLPTPTSGDGNLPHFAAKVNVAVYETQGQMVQGQLKNVEGGTGIAGMLRLLDLETAGRTDVWNQYAESRVGVGLVQSQVELLSEFDELPGLELLIAGGLRFGIQNILARIPSWTESANVRVALIFGKHYFAEAGFQTQDLGLPLKRSNIMEFTIGMNRQEDGMTYKIGVREQVGDLDPYYLIPKGWSLYVGAQQTF